MNNKELAILMALTEKPYHLASLLEDYFLYLSNEQIEQWKEIYKGEK
jgi:hypothetical protein